MPRILRTALVIAASILIIRTGQIHRDVWKAAESRKALLAHFVDHTQTLTEHEIDDARFWSSYGDYSHKTFTWYFFGGLCAAGAATWLDSRIRTTKVPAP